MISVDGDPGLQHDSVLGERERGTRSLGEPSSNRWTAARGATPSMSMESGSWGQAVLPDRGLAVTNQQWQTQFPRDSPPVNRNWQTALHDGQHRGGEQDVRLPAVEYSYTANKPGQIEREHRTRTRSSSL
ncbi:hypothetical protein ABW21_db0209270 [Orbilia brochopaga]|nr:hypothetical protein ABW21_db0209270 [Drechslerella brochopaga]